MNLRSLLPVGLFAALALFLFVGSACELDDDNNTNNQDTVSDILNQNATVNMLDGGGFDAFETTVGVGSSVTFQSGAVDAHFIEFTDPSIADLGEVGAGGSMTTTFNQAGNFGFECSYHGMQGAVNVQ